MRTLLLALVTVSTAAQTPVLTMKRTYYNGPDQTGVVIVSAEGKIKRAQAFFSYIRGGTDEATLFAGNHCSQNHTVSEIPVLGTDGRYLLRARPNPAYVAVYRGGVRLQPDVHYRLYWVDKSKLPDRFELLPGAPTEGVLMVDYVLGVQEAAAIGTTPQIAGLE